MLLLSIEFVCLEKCHMNLNVHDVEVVSMDI